MNQYDEETGQHEGMEQYGEVNIKNYERFRLDPDTERGLCYFVQEKIEEADKKGFWFDWDDINIDNMQKVYHKETNFHFPSGPDEDIRNAKAACEIAKTGKENAEKSMREVMAK